MRAAVMRDHTIVVDDIDDPTPGPGQVLVRTLACGVCGSDLHALHHGEQMVEMFREQAPSDSPVPLAGPMDLAADVVLGHEFSGEVIALGEGCWNHREGDIVVSMPVTFDERGLHMLGYSNDYPGGYAQRLVLSDALALTVPNALDPHLAALTEPMAVGLHAVNRSRADATSSAVVLGCGPVGLAVIAALAALGAAPIVGVDLSPTRRRLALEMGAHEVVDPQQEPAVDAWRRVGGDRRPLVLFEAVGVPGMLDDAMRMAPPGTQILVVGVCMEPDTIRPLRAISKELAVQFSFAYDPTEFAETLRRIAEGELDVAPMITGRVGLDGVAGAFEALADPDAHAKVLITP